MAKKANVLIDLGAERKMSLKEMVLLVAISTPFVWGLIFFLAWRGWI